MKSTAKTLSIKYYDEHAEAFKERTIHVDMSAIYKPFLELLEQHSRILDAGCGSGRDSRYFKRSGYEVSAFDASIEMVKLASKLTGIEVKHARFDTIQFDHPFDAIWACASLLHVPEKEMAAMITRLSGMLMSGGVFYMSFKYGEGEAFRNGRIFSNYNEGRFAEMISKVPVLEIIKLWQTEDERKRNNGLWLNALLRKA